MTVPTRIIESDEFTELIREEGGAVPLYRLTAIPFDPPLPPHLTRPNHKHISVNVMLLNVAEPAIYKDTVRRAVYIILNGYDQDNTFTYDNFRDCHIVKDAWCYRLSPHYWKEGDITDEFEDATYVFKHTTRDGQAEDDV